MTTAFKDPFSAASEGIESGVGIGLAIKRSNEEEDKFEFLKLQKELEDTRGQEDADRDFELGRLEKAFDFHVKTKNFAGSRKTLQAMDELGGTNLAERLTDDRMAEFNDKMKLLDKAAPEDQEGLMSEVMQGFPVLSHLAGIKGKAPEKEFTLKEGEKRFKGGEVVAEGGVEPGKPKWDVLVDENSPTGYSFTDLNDPAKPNIINAPKPKSGVSVNVGTDAETAFMKELGKKRAGSHIEEQAKAIDAASGSEIIKNQFNLLNSKEGIYSGTFAEVEKNFDKMLQSSGIEMFGAKAENTETFAANAGKLVGKVIRAFGSGTGLSDADREYAEKIAAGKVTMVEGALRRLLIIQHNANRRRIAGQNEKNAKIFKTTVEKLPADILLIMPPALETFDPPSGFTEKVIRDDGQVGFKKPGTNQIWIAE